MAASLRSDIPEVEVPGTAAIETPERPRPHKEDEAVNLCFDSG